MGTSRSGIMKLATFLLGVLAVNAQTTDPRRKKWKDAEPTTVDWTTTTTTTSTESTTTTSTTTSSTTRTTQPTTPPKLNLPSSDDALPNGTKELQSGMFQGEQGESADPDVSAASATNHGFNFGSGLSTKGIGTVDETRGGGGKKGKKDKKKKDKIKKDKPKKDRPKKDKLNKKPKDGKKKKKNKFTAPLCFATIAENFSMGPGVFISGKSTNPKKPSFLYDCEDKDMMPSHKIITCQKPTETETSIGFKLVPNNAPQPSGRKVQITCEKKSATRSFDLSKCTPEEAHDAMDSFNFSSKEYLFDIVIAMPMRAEITAACNPKYVTEPPVGGVLLLECDGQPTIINNVLTYWKPSLTSVADFDTFNC